jgi:hypothetical protein
MMDGYELREQTLHFNAKEETAPHYMFPAMTRLRASATAAAAAGKAQNARERMKKPHRR